MKGMYLVLVSMYYLKGTKVFDTKENVDTESERAFDLYMNLKNWKSIRLDGYLGLYEWDSEDVVGLRKYIAKKTGLNEVVLEIHKLA